MTGLLKVLWYYAMNILVLRKERDTQRAGDHPTEDILLHAIFTKGWFKAHGITPISNRNRHNRRLDPTSYH